MKEYSLQNKAVRRVAAAVIWLAVWQLAAALVNKEIALVGPSAAIRRLAELVVQPVFIRSVGNSLIHILSGMLAGMISGVILAVLSAKNSMAESIISVFTDAVRAVPVASFVILALMWMKSAYLSTFVSALIVYPVIYSSVYGSITTTDRKMLEMADVFGMKASKRIRYIYIPQIYPRLRSTLLTAAGLAFKSGTAAEVIGQPDFTLGDMLYRAKIYLETADLFAWTIAIIILGAACGRITLLITDAVYGRLQK